MFNNFSRGLRKKQNAHCAWTQSKTPRHCHVFTHSVSSVSTNWQTSQEDSYKKQSNVPFARLPFQFPTQTPLPICLLLFTSTDWLMSSLLRKAAYRLRNAILATITTRQQATVLFARPSCAPLVFSLTNASRQQEVIAMFWSTNYKLKMYKSCLEDPWCVHSNFTKINHWNFTVKIAKLWFALSVVLWVIIDISLQTRKKLH